MRILNRQVVTFGSVGLLGLGALEALLWILVHSGVDYLFAYLGSFELVMLLNFVLHDRITFRGDKAHGFLRRLWTYQLTYIVYRVLTFAIFFTASLFISIYLALLLSVVMGFGANYWMAKRLTWRSAARQGAGSIPA